MNRTSRISLFLFTALLAACTETPTALEKGDGVDPSAAAAALDPVGQTVRIEALVEAAEDAWAAKDPAAYAALFAEDAQFISPFGTYLSGRDAIRAQHVLLFGGPFAGSTLSIDIGNVVFVTGTIAVVDLRYALTDYRFLPPGLIAHGDGVFRVVVRWVVVKREGDWVVVAHQMTQVLPTS